MRPIVPHAPCYFTLSSPLFLCSCLKEASAEERDEKLKSVHLKAKKKQNRRSQLTSDI